MTCNACGHFVNEGQPCGECAGHLADVKEGRALCGSCREPLPYNQRDGTTCDACWNFEVHQ